MNKQRLIEGGIFIALGLITIMLSMQYTYMDKFTPGPGLFPFWLGVILAFLGAVMFLSGFRTATPSVRKVGLPRLRSLLPFAILVLLVATMSLLGALISIAIFTMILVRTVHRKTSWLSTISTGLLLSVACYVLFERLLGVPLPKGFLGI